jgi:hypothetical protein
MEYFKDFQDISRVMQLCNGAGNFVQCERLARKRGRWMVHRPLLFQPERRMN